MDLGAKPKCVEFLTKIVFDRILVIAPVLMMMKERVRVSIQISLEMSNWRI